MDDKTTQEANFDEFLKVLKTKIDAWIAFNPQSRNLAILAKKTGVTDSTLRRMLAGDGKITLDIVIVLLNTVLNSPIEARRLISTYYPHLATGLVFWAADVTNDGQHLESDMAKKQEAQLTDAFRYSIYLYADKGSYTLDDFQRLFGEKGVEVCQCMLADGFLVLNEQDCLRPSEVWITASLPLMNLYYQRFAEKAVRAKYTLWGVREFWLNMKTVKKIFNLEAEHQRELIKIANDNDSKGDIPFGFLHLMTLLDDEDHDSTESK